MSEQSNRQARVYTLAEARAALPVVKANMARIQAARQAILRLRPAALPAIQKAVSNGGSREAGELALYARQLEESVKVILAMGILIKDLDRGIIDFVGKRNGQEVCLCWRYGEEDIDFWHGTDAGFAGRRPIDSVVEQARAQQGELMAETHAGAANVHAPETAASGASLEARIQAVLDDYRPTLYMDGGDVQLLHVDEKGIAHVKMLGACIDCPISLLTMKLGIQRLLKENFSEIRGVNAITDIDISALYNRRPDAA